MVEGVGGRALAETIAGSFREMHEALRELLADADDDLVNRSAGPRLNSIATLLVHLTGSEAETVTAVAGIAHARDRDAEFTGAPRGRSELLALLDRADELLGAAMPLIDDERLAASVSLPTLPADDRRSGVAWLLGNYGHAREHVGEIRVTWELVRER
jgi:hypothetical protein